MTSLATQTETTPETGAGIRRKIAIQGYPGAFHDIAARLLFEGEEIDVIPAHTFEDLFELVELGEQANFGLMAIENTLAGSLMENYRLLNNSNLRIIGEVYLRIKQNLLLLPGARFEEVTEVHSHPIAIAQCREYFKAFPHIRLVETADTALSAKLVRDQGLKHVGAIASRLAAEMYGLNLYAESIETNKKNHTRFLLLKKGHEIPESTDEADKVSLCFSVDHEVGSLYKVLAVLAAYQVNLTKIQSAPIIGKPWEYLFFLDFVSEGKLGYQQAIDAIRPITHALNVMGVYRKGFHFEL